MKKRIEDNTLRELLEVLIAYREDLRLEGDVFHIGIKTQTDTSIKGLKKLLQINE